MTYENADFDDDGEVLNEKTVIDDDGNVVGKVTGDVDSDLVTTEDARITRGVAVSPDTHFPHQVEALTGASTVSFGAHPTADNPVAYAGSPSASDLSGSENSVDFIADPFWVHDGSQYHLFAEVAYTDGSGTDQEEIGHWKSDGGLSYTWDQIVVSDSGTHFAYPFVWKQDSTWYMVPDEASNGDFTVWTASESDFASSWTRQETNPSGFSSSDDIVDATPIYHDPDLHDWGGGKHRWFVIMDRPDVTEVQLWYSDAGEGDILGRSWSEHSASPIDDKSNYSGPGGRPLVQPGHVDVWYQSADSGQGVDLVRVSELTSSAFTQNQHGYPDSLLQQSKNDRDWRKSASHHVDLHAGHPTGEPLAVADYVAGSDSKAHTGNRSEWCVGLFQIAEKPVGALAYQDTQQTGISSESTVQFDGINKNYPGDWDTTNDHYFPSLPGYYRFEATVEYDPGADSGDKLVLFLNHKDNSNAPQYQQKHILDGNQRSISVFGEYYLESGDRVEVKINPFSTSSVDIIQTQDRTYLQVQRLHP